MGGWKIEKLGDWKIERLENLKIRKTSPTWFSPKTEHVGKSPILIETSNLSVMRQIILMVYVAISQQVMAQEQDEAFSLVDELLVFSEQSVESSLSFKIKKHEVFLIQVDQDANSDWVAIEFPSNMFSTFSDNSEKQFLVGFVQKPMIKRVIDLERYAPDDVVLNFQIVKAVEIPANRWVYGLEPPSQMCYSVSKITLEWKNGEMNLDHVFFHDLFNVTFSE